MFHYHWQEISLGLFLNIVWVEEFPCVRASTAHQMHAGCALESTVRAPADVVGLCHTMSIDRALSTPVEVTEGGGSASSASPTAAGSQASPGTAAVLHVAGNDVCADCGRCCGGGSASVLHGCIVGMRVGHACVSVSVC